MKAWYFSKEDCKLRFEDNRLIKPGASHWVFRKPKLCAQGLHASVDLKHAVMYSPGPILWRVELRGLKHKSFDNVAAMNRKYLWGVNFEKFVYDVAANHMPFDDPVFNKMKERHKNGDSLSDSEKSLALKKFTSSELYTFYTYFNMIHKPKPPDAMYRLYTTLPISYWEQLIMEKREDYAI